MNSKGIIAIIVVIILVAAGVGVGVFFANQNNGPGVDKIKENVEVGDIISYNMTTSTESVTKGISLEDFLSMMPYPELGTSTEKTKEITFKGKAYTCTGYEGTDTMERECVFWVTDGGFVLEQEFSMKGADNVILKDTSMDVALEKEAQLEKIEKGAFYDYDEINTKGEDVACVSAELTKYNKDSGETEVTSGMILYLGVHTHKVTSIDGDNITFDDGDATTVQELYGNLSKEKWIEYQQSQGFKVEQGAFTEKTTISTPFGDREVITGTFNVTDSSGAKSSTYEITYGNNGVIYEKTEVTPFGEEGYYEITTSYEKETTMIVSA